MQFSACSIHVQPYCKQLYFFEIVYYVFENPFEIAAKFASKIHNNSCKLTWISRLFFENTVESNVNPVSYQIYG